MRFLARNSEEAAATSVMRGGAGSAPSAASSLPLIKYDKFKILRDSTYYHAYYVCAGCGRVWQALRDGTRMGTRHAAKCYRCCSRALEARWLATFWVLTIHMQDLYFPGSRLQSSVSVQVMVQVG